MSRSRGLRQVEKVRRVACPLITGHLIGCGAPAKKKCVDADGRERESNHAARIRAHRDHYKSLEPRALPPAGFLAKYDSICGRCGGDITKLVHQIVQSPGSSTDHIHVGCYSGSRDGEVIGG